MVRREKTPLRCQKVVPWGQPHLPWLPPVVKLAEHHQPSSKTPQEEPVGYLQPLIPISVPRASVSPAQRRALYPSGVVSLVGP